jgi:hypothetical protein
MPRGQTARRAECSGGGGGRVFGEEDGEEEVVEGQEQRGDGSSGVRVAVVVEGGQNKVIGN